MVFRSLPWARLLLCAALVLCAISAVGGLLILVTIWLIAPLFIGSALLYALARQPTNQQHFGGAVAGVGAALGVFITADSAHFRGLLPIALAVLLTGALLLYHPTRRSRGLAAGLVLGFAGLAWAGLRAANLHDAVAANDPAWARLQLALGADPNALERGSPVLHEALREKQAGMVALLLAAGADPNARNNSSGTNTPVLFSAIWTKQPRLVDQLLAAGANPRRRDVLGRDAVQVACDYDYPDSVAVRRAAARFPPEPLPPPAPLELKE